jgi:hypothetical protein
MLQRYIAILREISIQRNTDQQYNSFYRYIHVENIKAAVNITVASATITHSGLKLVDKPFCTLCAVMCRPVDGDLLLKHVGG